jgi:hypothetical protein
MVDDGLTVFDLEAIILTGIVAERQRDRTTGDWKYLVLGQTVNGQRATVVARPGETGKLVIVTVFRESNT